MILCKSIYIILYLLHTVSGLRWHYVLPQSYVRFTGESSSIIEGYKLQLLRGLALLPRTQPYEYEVSRSAKFDPRQQSSDYSLVRHISNVKATERSLITQCSNSKDEVYVKYKRLKQLKSQGKSYQDYLKEQKIISATVRNESARPWVNDNDKDTEVDRMAKVIKYIKERDSQPKNSSNTISNTTVKSTVLERANGDLSRETTEYQNDQIIQSSTRNPYVVSLVMKSLDSLHVGNTKDRIINVAFLPDCSIDSAFKNTFYPELLTSIRANSEYCVSLIKMPNIHDFNTKRYEKLWMDHMRGQNLSSYDAIIAHGSNAEAILRYLESESLSSAQVLVLIDPTDLYTAGERHGRDFHYHYIANNAPRKVIVVPVSDILTKESFCVVSELKSLGVNVT